MNLLLLFASVVLVPHPVEFAELPGVCGSTNETERWDSSIAAEGYCIEVTPTNVVVTSSDAAGAFYARQTLAQLAEAEDGKTVYPCCRINDRPAYPWRGVMIDESRHFMGKETIKQVLDLMAYHKLNRLHWHLTDDQGWRIDVPGMPELVQYGSVRAESPIATRELVPENVIERIELLKDGDIHKHWYVWLKGEGRDSDPKKVFTAEGNTLKVSGEGMGCVTTRKAYRDYRLTLEFRYVDNDRQLNKTAARDGGILFHSNGPDGAYGKGIWMYSFEYNIIQGASGDLIVVGNTDNRPDAPHFICHANVDAATKGMLSQHWDPDGPEIELRDRGRVRRCDVDLDWQNLASQPLSPNENPIGEWNKAEVVCSGDSAEFFFNGKKVGEYRNLTPSSGRIQLQSEGFGIEYRNIVLEPVE